MLKRKSVAALAALLALGLVRGASAGDSDSKRMSVTARGQASGAADSVEVEFTVTARTEECGEAEKKFRDKLARVEKALKEGEVATPSKKKSDDDDDDDAPKKKKAPTPPAKPGQPPKKNKKKTDDDDDDDDVPPVKKKKDEPKKEEPAPAKEKPADTAAPIAVTITERNLSIGVKSSKGEENAMARIMAGRMGVQPEKNDSPMTVTCKVVATIADVRSLDRTAVSKRIAQLIDLGIDGGADGADGEAPVVRFLLKDSETLRKAAYKDAMTRAKQRAAELAELAGREVGPVASIREESTAQTQPKPEEATASGEKLVAALYGFKTKDGATVVPSMDVQAEVELRVEFEIK